jgi:two-component system CheB/CheR fusion protein
MGDGQTVLTDPTRMSGNALRVLMIEDSAEDAELQRRHLTKAGHEVFLRRITRAEEMREALADHDWDLIIADYAVPGFGAIPALTVLKQSGRDIPFLIVSGTISDETAVEAMRAGAHDYILKNNLSRLVPAIQREMQEAVTRQHNRQMEAVLRLQVAALNSAANSIVITDRDGTIQWVNAAFTKLTGYAAEEAIGQNPRVLKSGKHDGQFYQDMWRTILSGAVWRGEVINRRKDEGLYVEEMTITPVCSTESEISHFVAVKEDISDRKQAEEVRATLAAIVEYSGDAIISKSLDGMILSWNRSAERLFGYSEEEAVGQPISLIVPPDRFDEEAGFLERLRSGEPVHQYETLRMDRNGRSFDVSLTISPIRNESGEVIAISKSIRDITERRQAERALRNNERLATTGRLAATIAHEIHNPLDAVGNLLYLAAHGTQEETTRGFISQATVELERVTQMTQQMLSFQREASKPIPVNIGEILDNVAAMYERKIEFAGINLKKQLNSDKSVLALPGELRQMFANLLGNAIEAVGKRNGTIVLRVSQGRNWQSGQIGLRVVVADDGPGIPASVRERIFEPFFTTKGESGTGLGLWITSDIVRKNKGTIRLRTNTKEGSSGTHFSVFFPFEIEPELPVVA